MPQCPTYRSVFSAALLACTSLGATIAVSDQTSFAQETPAETRQARRETREPIFRVPRFANRNANQVTITPASVVNAAPTSLPSAVDNAMSSSELDNEQLNTAPIADAHPLDRAINRAQSALDLMQREVNDYQAIMVKRERVNDKMSEPEFMQLKIRCPRQLATGPSPFSIYMKFMKPRATAGREVIWMNGRNNNKLCVHEGSGLISLKSFDLDPDGWVAMQDNRYPIYEAGLENLIIKLVEKAERDRAAGPCEVNYRENAQINNRSCEMIEVIHSDRRAPYDFHKAQVFIDSELQLPVRYAAWDWPCTDGGKPKLLEEYTYVNVKLNVGLTDADFDPANPKYKYKDR